jgi:uncharacterized protein (DUF1330 family)
VTIEPTHQQIERIASSSEEGAVVMLNLLRFKDRADGPEERSGMEAYATYGQRLQPLFEQIGAEVLMVLNVAETVIGPEAGEWDMVVLVRYPSRAAFMQMLTHPDYADIHLDRAAALEEAGLLACQPLVGVGA